jgi:DNA-directed RNA polymerase specialized sigma24 family protein
VVGSKQFCSAAHDVDAASLRSWLHKIAANGCLNALHDRSRRPREVPTLAPRWAEFAMISSWLAGFIAAGVADGQFA